VRSMGALNNYVALDRRGRSTLDLMMSDIRGCSEITSATPSGTYSNLTSITFRTQPGGILTYEFDPDLLTLTRTDNLTNSMMLLTNCTGGFDIFLSALKTNSWNQYDTAAQLSDCKVVKVNWSSYRTLWAGSTTNNISHTEDIVTARILMRN
jgi:hypothetical protein